LVSRCLARITILESADRVGMMIRMNIIWRPLVCSIILLVFCGTLMGQVECSGWGELRGIRIDGQLFPVITTLTIASPNWRQTAQTAHWRTRESTYAHEGEDIISTGKLALGQRASSGVSFRQTISNSGPGMASINLQVTADTNLELDGVYMYVSVPAKDFAMGSGELVGGDGPANRKVNFATSQPADKRRYVNATAIGARVVGPYTVELTLPQAGQIGIEDDRGTQSKQLSLLFPIHVGSMKRGESVQTRFTIKVTGAIDHSPVNVRIDPMQPGQAFSGIGGNFCWQLDSPTVNYYLDNFRIVLARVSFPIPLWQPRENGDPTTQPTDQLPDELQTDLHIATELHRRKIPMILTVWSAPDWAIVHRLSNRPQPGGSRSTRIDPAKWNALATSIGSYLLRFKQVVGTEPDFFSFNESNLGINVLMSAAEHRDAIKLLGARFAKLGLHTKMLLGDANEPRAVDYVKAALADPKAMQYVGAVSYHSWNGGTDEQLVGWHEHAMEAHLPLIVAEAGYDPDASHYRPQIDEPWYALEEVKLNLQCITLSQPEAILHWQFTPDYGLVTGGSSPADPIRTTQRWWQYKQLSELTPPGAAILPVTSDSPAIAVSALAATGQGVSVVHIANTGAEREAFISGLPSDLKEMRCWVTDHTRSMQPIDSGGTLEVTVPAQSFLTLAR
jgi:O-glycosyl hydrolase